MRWLILTGVVFVITACTPSPASWGPLYDAWAKQPGAKIAPPPNTVKAEDTRSVSLPSGVSASFTRKSDGSISVVEVDNSGHGALLCAQGFYIEFNALLDICSGNEAEQQKKDMHDALDRINAFIAANNLIPITKFEIEEQIQKQFQGIKALSADELNKMCHSGDSKKMLDNVLKMTHEQIEKNLKDLLSVPRPAVINPCV